LALLLASSTDRQLKQLLALAGVYIVLVAGHLLPLCGVLTMPEQLWIFYEPRFPPAPEFTAAELKTAILVHL